MSDTRWFQHPLWLAGFRPFFALAFLSGALLPLLWGAVFAGWLSLPASAPSPVVWHANEMFYGFGWAVLGGFLLTASKNWVGVRGIHGWPLALAALLWLLERGALLVSGDLPGWMRPALLNASVLYVGGYVIWTLVRHRKQDTFSDNYFFLVALPLFLVARSLMLDLATFATGVAMTVGLFRVAFVVMIERTVPQFMKSGPGVALVRHGFVDHPIKALTLLLVFQPFLPSSLAVGLLCATATLLLVRFALWKPLTGLRRFDIGVMYVGYLGLTAHLCLEALHLSGLFVGLGAVSTHMFTFLCMGIIIPGMLIRISQGHTGRKLLFTRGDRVAIGAVGVGAFFRLVATQLWPAHYLPWIALSSLTWTVCFGLLGIRLTPFLWQPRIDGREH